MTAAIEPVFSAQRERSMEDKMNHEDQFIPHLIVNDGMAALQFYKEVFGAEEGHNMMAPDGRRLMHGEMVLDGHKFFVSDEFTTQEGGSCKAPQTLGGTSVRITLMTNDPDAIVELAVARGARSSCRCRICSGGRAMDSSSI